MSYREENGLVILSMSREDYAQLDGFLRVLDIMRFNQVMMPGLREFRDRLNSGNPNYTPYQVEAKKSGVDSRTGLPHIPDVD